MIEGLGVKGNEVTRKADDAWGTFLAGNHIVLAEGEVEEMGEGTADEGHFLVEGIEGGIGQVLDVAFPTAGIEGWGKEGVEVKEFVAMVREGLEGNSFGMAEIEEIEGFGKRGKGNLQVAVVGQQDAIVGRDEEAAGGLELEEGFADGADADTTTA